jgi:uncharacterized membrane protein YeaQ/YmgE (transglycosylase-associated protein family)
VDQIKTSDVPRKGGKMAYVTWVLFGMISGYFGSKVINRRGKGLYLDVFLGVVGAVAGGLIFNLLNVRLIPDFDGWALPVCITGSIMMLTAYHTFRRALGTGV